MALVVYDRVQETTATTGTGTLTLGGPVAGFQSFAAVGNGNTTFYCIVNNSAWEVGIGTYSTTGPTLARTTVLSNSNNDTSPINLSGASVVFCTYPSDKSVNLDASGNVSPLGTITSGTWNGSTIPVAYGGTGVTASSGANSVVLRDSNQNVAFNNFTASAVAVVAAAGTTTLTVASARTQILIGSTTQTFVLPDATTLVLGQSFVFVNNSSGALTIQNNALATIEVIPPGGISQLGATSIATTAGTWGIYSFLPGTYNFSIPTADFGNATIVDATWNGGTVQTGYGGTGLTTFTGANNALYSTSSSALAAGTLPVAAGGTGITSLDSNRIPYGDGTNPFVSSPNFTYDGTALLVGDGSGLAGATNPVIASVGSANNYIQSYIYNKTNGANSSSDFTAYPSNGSDANGWLDIGINSLAFSSGTYAVTGPNESYIFASAPSGSGTTGNLVYATDVTGTENYHQWYVNGFDKAKSAWGMQLSTSGLKVAGSFASTSTTIATAATITPPSDTTNQYTVTALDTAATIAIPSGTPIDGQKLTLRIKDDGTSRALSWTTSAGGYRVIGVELPTSTGGSKVNYIGCIYNSQDSFWDVVSVATQA